MSQTPKHNSYDVVISGGGIAGLLSALFLSLLNKRILIIEKFSTLNANGADVLKPSGIKILQRYGLLNQVKRSGAQKREKVDIFHDAELLATMDYNKHNKLPYFYLFPYHKLIKIVHDHILNSKSIEIIYNQEIKSLHKDPITNNYHTAVLNSGIEIQAELFVGCDGVHSKLRQLVKIECQPSLYNHVIYFNQLPIVESVKELNRLYVDHKGGLAYFYPISDTEFRFLIGFKKDEGQQLFLKNDLNTLKERLFKFVNHSNDAIDQLQSLDGFKTFPLMKMNLKRYYKNNTVFLGNAAHLVHPITGQGMNTAIEDAGEFALQMESYYCSEQTLEDALERYEMVRKQINGKVVNYGDQLISNMHDKKLFKQQLNLKMQTSSRVNMTVKNQTLINID